MRRIQTLQDLFRRYRRPGDFVIAALSFGFALFLAASLPFQVDWVDRTGLFAQPAFWPAVSIALMVLFSAMHLIGALVSERIPGRLAEVVQCVKALEYVAWFIAYVLAVPILGYLPATLLFAIVLTLRLGYRGWRWIGAAALFARESGGDRRFTHRRYRGERHEDARARLHEEIGEIRRIVDGLAARRDVDIDDVVADKDFRRAIFIRHRSKRCGDRRQRNAEQRRRLAIDFDADLRA